MPLVPTGPDRTRMCGHPMAELLVVLLLARPPLAPRAQLLGDVARGLSPIEPERACQLRHTLVAGQLLATNCQPFASVRK